MAKAVPAPSITEEDENGASFETLDETAPVAGKLKEIIRVAAEVVNPDDEDDEDDDVIDIGEDELPGTVYVATPQMHYADVDFEAQDRAIPRLRLLQALSQDVTDRKGLAGQWIISGHPAADEVLIIPHGWMKIRELRNDEGNIAGISPDAKQCCIKPKRRCEACPNAQWREGEGGTRVAPKCNEVWVYDVTVVEPYDIQAQLRLTKTSLPAARFINEQLSKRGLSNVAILLESAVEKSKVGGRGQFYVAKATVGQVEPDVLEAARLAAVPQQHQQAQLKMIGAGTRAA